MSTPTPSSEEWIRLPRPKERCPVTGLSRTSLVEILDEKDPATGELCVKQYRKERHGKQRRIRLIHRESLLAFLDRRARAQNALRFAAHVNNPNNETVETVLKNFDLFELFLGEDNGVTNFDWEEGRLSTRGSKRSETSGSSRVLSSPYFHAPAMFPPVRQHSPAAPA